jgi:hypothetical protein
MAYRDRNITCATCGTSFVYAGPGTPRYCDRHKPARARRSSLEIARRQGDTARVAVLEAAAGDGGLEATESTKLLRLAGMLAIAGSDEEAAELAHVEERGKALRRLCDEARKRWGRLVEGNHAALLELTHRGLQQLVVDLLAAKSPGTKTKLVQAIRQLSDAIETLTTGSAKPVFGSVTFVIEEVDADTEKGTAA